MSLSPVLPKLLDLLSGGRADPQGGGPGGAAGLEGPGPDLEGLPPGIAQRVADHGPDALPPGLARQLLGGSGPGPGTPAAGGPAAGPSAGQPNAPSLPPTPTGPPAGHGMPSPGGTHGTPPGSGTPTGPSSPAGGGLPPGHGGLPGLPHGGLPGAHGGGPPGLPSLPGAPAGSGAPAIPGLPGPPPLPHGPPGLGSATPPGHGLNPPGLGVPSGGNALPGTSGPTPSTPLPPSPIAGLPAPPGAPPVGPGAHPAPPGLVGNALQTVQQMLGVPPGHAAHPASAVPGLPEAMRPGNGPLNPGQTASPPPGLAERAAQAGVLPQNAGRVVAPPGHNAVLPNAQATASQAPNPSTVHAGNGVLVQTARGAMPGTVPAQPTPPSGHPNAAAPAAHNAADGTAATRNAAATSATPPTRADAAPPARADALPPRNEAATTPRVDPGLVGRLAALLRPGAAPPAAPMPPTSTPVAAPIAGEAAGATLAAAALGAVAAQDPRVLPAAAERGPAIRPDAVPPNALYTADGPFRRPLRRGLRALPATVAQWLYVFGATGGPFPVRTEDPRQRDAARLFHWLFWVFTVVAYACLGVALVALLPVGTAATDSPTRTGLGTLALFVGFGMAAAAWWIARRMAARPGTRR